MTSPPTLLSMTGEGTLTIKASRPLGTPLSSQGEGPGGEVANGDPRMPLRNTFRNAAAVLAMALLSILPAPARGADDQPRLDRLEAEIAALRAELAALKSATETAPAPPAPPASDLAELERRLEILAAALEQLRLGTVDPAADRPEHGMGPAASKIYRAESGVSIGGYGELVYQNFDSERDDGAASGRTDEADFLRAVLYVGYKFNDRLLFNSELEFEHAQTAADRRGSTSVEFAYLDYLWRPELNLRGGLLLLPMGLTNELHEPTVFPAARRPGVETVILPTTWRENGFGVFGDAGPVSYRAYAVTGFDAAGFSAAGLRGGRQGGSFAKAEDFALVGRVDWTATPGLLVGGSLYAGDAGQGGPVSTGVRIGEIHGDWRWRGWQASALVAQAQLSNVAALNRARGLTGDRSLGERLRGYTAQVGYDLFSAWRAAPAGQRLVAFARHEAYDTQARVPAGFLRNPANDIESLTAGFAYQPIDQVILKLDFQDQKNAAGTGIDQWNVALGYVF